MCGKWYGNDKRKGRWEICFNCNGWGRNIGCASEPECDRCNGAGKLWHEEAHEYNRSPFPGIATQIETGHIDSDTGTRTPIDL